MSAVTIGVIFAFSVGVAAGYIFRNQIQGALQQQGLALQGYHEGVWYDDLAAKPIDHTIFGPFQNEYEDPQAGVTPAGLTPPRVDTRMTIA